MHVSASETTRHGRRYLRFALRPTEGDVASGPRARLVRHEALVELLPAQTVAELHPDFLALAALSLAQPFTRRLSLDRGVSAGAAEAFQPLLDVGPVDDGLQPRGALSPFVAGLAFSGGFDSAAAATVMKDSPAVFMNRLEAGSVNYDSAPFLEVCRGARRLGYDIHVLGSDCELLVSPTGFPTSHASALPIIVNADALGVSAVGWGTVLESAYHIGRLGYTPPAAFNYIKRIQAFAGASLPFAIPTAGVSEVGTALLLRDTPLGALARSCPRGVFAGACNRCWKCLRKGLLDLAIAADRDGVSPPPEALDRLFANPSAVTKLATLPIKHEDVVVWSAKRIAEHSRRVHPLVALLLDRVDSADDLRWLERWYGPSLELVAPPLREDFASRLDGYLPRMTEEDEARCRSYDLRARMADLETAAARDRLVSALHLHAGTARRSEAWLTTTRLKKFLPSGVVDWLQTSELRRRVGGRGVRMLRAAQSARRARASADRRVARRAGLGRSARRRLAWVTRGSAGPTSRRRSDATGDVQQVA